MSRPRLKKQEVVFIGIPTLCILGGAAFFARQQSLRELDSKGPYRTEITSVEVLPVSPFEAWQGFDTKIVVHAQDKGRLDVPSGIQLSSIKRLCQKMTITGQIKGQMKSFAVSTQDRIQGYEPEHAGILRALTVPQSPRLKDSITFLAATSKFDVKAPIQLRGDLWFERSSQPQSSMVASSAGWKSQLLRGSLSLLKTRSQTAQLTQPLERVGFADVNRVPSPVDKTRVDILSPSFAHTSYYGDEGSAYVAVFFRLSPEMEIKFPYPKLRCTKVRVFDAQGTEVQLKNWHGRPVFKRPVWTTEGRRQVALVKLPVESVPLQRGQLTLSMWLALEDEWPVKIQTVVRPAWMSRLPKKLQLQSVRVDKSSVIVRARYMGRKLLEWGNGRAARNMEMLGFFDSRSSVTPLIPPHKAGYDRLIPFWSQHFSLSNGKSYWFQNTVNLSSVSCDATNNCRFIYKTNAFTTLKPGQSARFFAQIGLDGDGFLPIQATITRPKK